MVEEQNDCGFVDNSDNQWIKLGILLTVFGGGLAMVSTTASAKNKRVVVATAVRPDTAVVGAQVTHVVAPKVTLKTREAAQVEPSATESSASAATVAVQPDKTVQPVAKTVPQSQESATSQGIPPDLDGNENQIAPEDVPDYNDEQIDQWMPNKTLQQAVLFHLNHRDQDWPPSQVAKGKVWRTVADITQRDMADLQNLFIDGAPEWGGQTTYIDGQTEFSLKGLEYAINLEAIDISPGYLNYPPYSFMGDVVDVEPLRHLKKLKYAFLQYNRIQDVAPLSDLPNLVELWLNDNEISDFSPLADIWNRQQTTFQISEQYVTLPRITLQWNQRTYRLDSPFVLPDGTEVTILSMDRVYRTLRWDPKQQPEGRQYYAGSQGEENDDEDSPDYGSVDYADILPQQSGTPDNANAPQLDHYQLLAAFQIGKEDYDDFFEDEATLIEDQGVNFYLIQPYDMVAAPVTVRFQDEAGHVIAPPQTLKSGLTGQSYAIEPPKIPGYQVIETPATAKGTYSIDPLTITYKYLRIQGDQPHQLAKPHGPVSSRPVEPTVPLTNVQITSPNGGGSVAIVGSVSWPSVPVENQSQMSVQGTPLTTEIATQPTTAVVALPDSMRPVRAPSETQEPTLPIRKTPQRRESHSSHSKWSREVVTRTEHQPQQLPQTGEHRSWWPEVFGIWLVGWGLWSVWRLKNRY